MGMKISILYLGKMEFPKFRLVDWKDEGAMVQSPAVAILIQHPTLGNILYDTGNCEDFSAVYTEEMLHDYPITEMISIREALAQKGLTPDDIDLIILSHLHFDHAGGLKHFVGTKAIRLRTGLRGGPEKRLLECDDRQRRGVHGLCSMWRGFSFKPFGRRPSWRRTWNSSFRLPTPRASSVWC